MRTGGRTDRQIDGYEEANSRFTQLCERFYKLLIFKF
jgi:hypothetical protein